ncbi:MAG: hypothetical protein ACRDRH_15875 [Pseudonocardia sp.]
MLQPRQLARERLVGLQQLHELPRPRGDLLVLRSDPADQHGHLLGLAAHHDNQLVARHLLQLGHRTIKPHTRRSPRDRHAGTARLHHQQLSRRSVDRLNVYRNSGVGSTASAQGKIDEGMPPNTAATPI